MSGSGFMPFTFHFPLKTSPLQEDKMKKISLIALFFLLLSTGVVPLYAASWNIDNNHSGMYFRINHIYSKVQGHFNDFSGTFDFDPENLAASKISFEIKVESIDTNIAKRDKHLLSKDFFDAAKHPTMSFSSNSITKTGENSFEAKGKFTVKGETYDLVLPLKFAGMMDHPREKNMLVAGFDSNLVLDRLEYKIGSGTFYKAGVVDKDVEILVSLEVMKKK